MNTQTSLLEMGYRAEQDYNTAGINILDNKTKEKVLYITYVELDNLKTPEEILQYILNKLK